MHFWPWSHKWTLAVWHTTLALFAPLILNLYYLACMPRCSASGVSIEIFAPIFIKIFTNCPWRPTGIKIYASSWHPLINLHFLDRQSQLPFEHHSVFDFMSSKGVEGVVSLSRDQYSRSWNTSFHCYLISVMLQSDSIMPIMLNIMPIGWPYRNA